MLDFVINFSNQQSIIFEDVIELNEDQKKTINDIASNTTQIILRARKYGYDINLTEIQKKIVIDSKNLITQSISSDSLYKNNTIIFSKHSIDRIISRVGLNEIPTYIKVIDRIKTSDKTYKAQWKGNVNLSYTLIRNQDPDRYKIVISFVRRGQRIYIVTVINSKVDPMKHEFAKSNKDESKLLKLKKALQEKCQDD